MGLRESGKFLGFVCLFVGLKGSGGWVGGGDQRDRVGHALSASLLLCQYTFLQVISGSPILLWSDRVQFYDAPHTLNERKWF